MAHQRSSESKEVNSTPRPWQSLLGVRPSSVTVKEASAEFLHARKKNNSPAINNLKQSHDKLLPKTQQSFLKEEDTDGILSHGGNWRVPRSCVAVTQTLWVNTPILCLHFHAFKSILHKTRLKVKYCPGGAFPKTIAAISWLSIVNCIATNKISKLATMVLENKPQTNSWMAGNELSMNNSHGLNRSLCLNGDSSMTHYVWQILVLWWMNITRYLQNQAVSVSVRFLFTTSNWEKDIFLSKKHLAFHESWVLKECSGICKCIKMLTNAYKAKHPDLAEICCISVTPLEWYDSCKSKQIFVDEDPSYYKFKTSFQ